jgi:hypothetical protein
LGVLGTVYFWKISKECLYIEIFGCGSGIVAMLAISIIPESPKFLITMKRYNEARDAINYISKINKIVKGNFSRQFDREVADRSARMGRLNSSNDSMSSISFVTSTVIDGESKK